MDRPPNDDSDGSSENEDVPRVAFGRELMHYEAAGDAAGLDFFQHHLIDELFGGNRGDPDQEEMEEELPEEAPVANDNQNPHELLQYEISRSSRHEYLGDTEEVTGRTVVSDEDFIKIPILIPSATHNLVLMPSQTLPLTIFCPLQQSMLRNVIDKDRIIGMIHTRPGANGHNKFDQYGTTAEIYEYHQEEGGPSLSVKAKGRQRFKLIDTHREVTGCIIARVKILPEIRMPDPLYHVRLFSQLKRNTAKIATDAGQKLRVRDVGSVRTRSAWTARRQASLLTPWPSWVYDIYDDEQLAIRLVNDIVTQFNMLEDRLQIPTDPQELSHWAAINLPLNDSQRLSLLSLNTATQRLRFILCIVSQSSKGLFCSYCGRLIANTSNIICMSTDGPQGTFVNPDGYIHEMITVTKVNHVRFTGKPSTRHSWFPGYAWRIVNCNTCRGHIGWLFTAEKNLKPKSFYGITRMSVKTRLTEETNPLQYVI